MENEIMEKFLSINEQNCNPTIGKYSSKKETFYEDIEKWQEERNDKDHIIKPIQFTFLKLQIDAIVIVKIVECQQIV